MSDLHNVYNDTLRAIEHLRQSTALTNKVVVVGTSTSEVAGKHIGTDGSLQIAEAIYRALFDCATKYQFQLAFQSCEHLNRALVVERTLQENKGYDEVTVIPIQKAGGSLATYAYKELSDPVLIEYIRADAGIDIGETMIGMHLKPVAVPVRYSNPYIGHARVLLAKTRPKLIGGARAVY
ncbi:TIGR01440 family protein [Desulfuribacillus alkaliarsenatis]|uniref:UPF0340 protein BHF68_06795 n=1 Tax=Desulfuribacillus alkaliarsenatis TaxID=766136 RepID=A0A1E5G1I4_9FIRM|nr:TIGR01440 family protein [Desulfuribacillus alkaliarsenatis]OEF96770.1 TIGR01440 family protein [Desulfuribacillus alkaliarsenatis]